MSERMMVDLSETIERLATENWWTKSELYAVVEAAAPIIERHVRAEVAKGIAEAIEAHTTELATEMRARTDIDLRLEIATVWDAGRQFAAVARGYIHTEERP